MLIDGNHDFDYVTNDFEYYHKFLSKDGLLINPEEPAEGVSPGQAAVIYDQNMPSKVLGGGWIVSTKSNLISKYGVSSSAA